MRARRIQIGLIAAIAAASGALLTLAPAAGVGAVKADVTLQVVPRGHGTVVSDAATGARVCDASEEPNDCRWTFAAGTTVVLSPRPTGSSAVRWSTPDCPGAGACRVTVDEDTSIVVLLGKLTLSVQTSGARSGDVVTSDPAGISCPPACEADFDVGATVKLTVRTASGSTFTSFPYGCTSTTGTECTVTVLDQPQSVGVKLNGESGPVAPTVVKVTVQVKKGGDGAGRVTATGLDCGAACSASLPYGSLATFAATPDGGSTFDGWGGVCAADRDPRCTLPIGPITILRPRFVRDAPPTAPTDLKAAAVSSSSISLTWTAATDDRGVASYAVFVDDETAPRLSTPTTTATLAGLACGQTYAVSVAASDAAGNQSPKATLQTTTAPCAPATLRVSLAGSNVQGRPPARLVCRFRSTLRARGSSQLVVKGTRTKKEALALRPGLTTVVFPLPATARKKRVRVVLSLADPQGGTRRYSWSFRIPK